MERMTDDIVERLRRGGARCGWGTDFARCPTLDDCPECDCAREAADEIERLRGQVAELLPFALQDAKSGASMGAAPLNHECGPLCDDCQWYDESLLLLNRINSDEFGPVTDG